MLDLSLRSSAQAQVSDLSESVFPRSIDSAHLLTQFDGVERLIFRQTTQNRQLSAEHVAIGDCRDYFFAADSTFSIACVI